MGGLEPMWTGLAIFISACLILAAFYMSIK
jgi:hypothetical protein